MRPLDGLGSIKLKLGVIIVGAVTVTTLAIQLGEERFGLVPSFILATAIGLAAVQVLARGMTSPLREMSLAARAMAKGDYSKRVHESSQDEVGELARSFNSMVTELEALDRLRRDLVANASHELRTPLTALNATLENVADGLVPLDEVVPSMVNQVRRLSHLVEQLTDLSKLESGVVPLEVQRFDIGKVLTEAADEARAANSKALDYVVRVQPEDLEVTADRNRVHQVVANLLENAARHSPERSAITLEAHGSTAATVISVSDEGPGIPEGERDKVFERFYRLDDARSSESGGSGLGLAIARWIVDLHGGSIEVASNGSIGCRMVVTLPEGRG